MNSRKRTYRVLDSKRFKKNEQTVFTVLLIIEAILIIALIIVSITLAVNTIKDFFSERQEPITNEVIQQYFPESQSPEIIVLTPTPIPLGKYWLVVSIEESVLLEDGKKYDIATFVNENNSNVYVKAKCIDPYWPVPDPGTRYFENEDDSFTPVLSSVAKKLQRFQLLPP